MLTDGFRCVPARVSEFHELVEDSAVQLAEQHLQPLQNVGGGKEHHLDATGSALVNRFVQRSLNSK
jgi:hypothetical protein